MPALSKVQFRRGTAASWAAANPVLALGEPGYATDTGQEKVGDGVTAWLSLPVSGSTTFATPAQVAAPQTTLVRNSANGKRWRSYVDDTGTSKVDPATIPGQFAAGGFYNAAVPCPSNQAIQLCGGDNGGIFRSTDGGQTWRPRNSYVTALWNMKVAGFAWSPSTYNGATPAGYVAGLVYCVVANGTNMMLLRSLDYGDTWATGGTAPARTDSVAVGIITDGDSYPRQAGNGALTIRPSTGDVFIGTTAGWYKVIANTTTHLVPATGDAGGAQLPGPWVFSGVTGARTSNSLVFDSTDDAVLYGVVTNALTWAASTAKTLGNLVVPTTPNGYAYVCTTAGTTGSSAPTWPTTPAATVTDGTAVWTQAGKYGTPLLTWTASTAKTVGQLTIPTSPAGHIYQCTAITTGLTAGSQPTWPTTTGATVTDGGVTWQEVGLSVSTAVAKAYIAADSDASQGTIPTAAFTTVVYNTAATGYIDVQDLAAVKEGSQPVLYVAAGVQGVKKHTRPIAANDSTGAFTTSGNWADKSGTIPLLGTGFRAAAVTGYYDGSATHLLVGHAINGDRATNDTLDQTTLGGIVNDSWWDLILESVDGGTTWASLTTAVKVSNNVGGSAGQPWWLMTAKAFYYSLGRQGYKVSQLSYIANGDGTYDILSAGKGGMWRYYRAQAKWYPIVNGLSIIIAFDVAVDPTDAKKVAVACNDWTVIGHTARLNGSTQPTMMQPSGMDTTNGPITAYGVEFGQSGSILGKLYAATGKRDDTSGGEPGEVYRWDNPWTAPTTATALGFSSVATGNSSGGPAVGRIQGVFPFLVGSVENVLAYVSGSGGGTPTPGIWLKVGSATPTQVLTLTANPAAFDSLTVRFVRDANGVFGVYIPDQGLYTCADQGVTWTKRLSTTTTGDRHVGRLALDPTSSGRWYLTTDQGGTTRQLLKLTVATNGTVTSTDITPAGILPAGVTVDPSNGDVWIRQQADSGSAKLLVSAAGGASFSQILDDGFAAQVPFGYASRHDGVGNLYVTTDGIGVATGATRSY